jgi:hypothetical protein
LKITNEFLNKEERENLYAEPEGKLDSTKVEMKEAVMNISRLLE